MPLSPSSSTIPMRQELAPRCAAGDRPVPRHLAAARAGSRRRYPTRGAWPASAAAGTGDAATVATKHGRGAAPQPSHVTRPSHSVEHGPYPRLVVHLVQLGDELLELCGRLTAKPALELVTKAGQPCADQREDRATQSVFAALRVVLASEVALVFVVFEHTALQCPPGELGQAGQDDVPV